MTKFVFPDTNVFLHCKIFTEIAWRTLFEVDQENDEIVIVVPYMVNKELDDLKRIEKKARNIQKKLKDLNENEFEEGITLNISIFPTKWSSLKTDWAELLDENESDCKIIAEILVFKEKNPDNEVFFVTGDNTPYFQAKALGINTIFWLDEKYIKIFKPSKIQPKRKDKLTDLKIIFKNGESKNRISKENELSLEDFIAEEFPEFPDLMIEEEEEIDILKDAEEPKISKELTIKEAKEKGLIVGDVIKSLGQNRDRLLSTLSFLNIKSRTQFREEVLKFYEQMKEYWKYIEIELGLINKGNKPYNNVNIDIFTVLEKSFILKSKEELEKPEKPKRERNLFSIPSLPMSIYSNREYNVKYGSPKKIEKEKNDIWLFGYSVKKIQHNDILGLYPITIKFPEEFKTKKIQFNCSFKHDEEGVTKEQKLTIDII